MHALGTFLIRIITVLFFVGMAGSVIVIVISFFEDIHELFGPDEPSSEPKPVQLTSAGPATQSYAQPQ